MILVTVLLPVDFNLGLAIRDFFFKMTPPPH